MPSLAMRNVRPLLAVLLLTIVATGAGAQVDPDTRQAIERAYEQIGRTFDAKDAPAYLNFFSPDAKAVDTFGFETVMADTGTSLLLSVGKSNSRYTIEEVVASGGDASSAAAFAWDGELIIKGTPYPARMEVEEGDTWTKASGDWRMSRSQQRRSKVWFGDTLILDREADLPPPAAERAALLAEIRDRAVMVKSVHAESGFEDLEGIGAMIGDARIVALGEATHGTAEFFKMKHRLVEYLVERKGFSVLGMESNWSEARGVDAYINSEEGDADKATTALGEPWATLEVRDMIAWMRSRNARRGDRMAISLFGFDMQSPGAAPKCVGDYFARLSAADQAEIALLYEDPGDIEALSGESVSKLRAQALRVGELIDARQGELTKVLSAAEEVELSRCARHVIQAYDLRASTSPGLRDALMAENARLVIDESYAGRKVILWAHNDHVASWSPGPDKSMGAHLRDAFGDRMFVLGFAAEGGQVRARRIKGNDVAEARRGPYVSLPLAAAVPFSVEALFKATGLERFALDLRHVQPDSGLGRWLSRKHLMRDLGWPYDPDDQTYGYGALSDLAASFDALIFIAESSAAQPLRAAGNSP